MSRPLHIYLDNHYYFITGRTVGNNKLFDTNRKRKLLLNVICEAICKFDCSLYGWVILSDHYHILIRVSRGDEIKKLMQIIHGRSSRRLRKFVQSEGRLISLPSRDGIWRIWKKTTGIVVSVTKKTSIPTSTTSTTTL